MNNRICQSPIFNAPTYPGECIYIPDMLVSIVALSNYAHQYSGKYQSTVDKWIKKASSEWIDQETGLLASFLEENHGKAQIVLPVKGSYSALNCYYLSLVDPEFAKEQYDCLMKNYKQGFPFAGIKEGLVCLVWILMQALLSSILVRLEQRLPLDVQQVLMIWSSETVCLKQQKLEAVR